MATANPKYRPSLTLPQMQSIVDNLPQNSPHYRTIRSTLLSLIIKASSGIVQPAFVSVEKPSLEESLGLSNSTGDSGESLWKLYNEGVPLSPKQKLSAFGYAFNSDLLTPEQELEYTSLLTS